MSDLEEKTRFEVYPITGDVPRMRSHRAPGVDTARQVAEGIGACLLALSTVFMIGLLWTAGLGDAVMFILSYVDEKLSEILGRL